MRELKFRYTYRRKDDGHIWQIIVPIDGIEDGSSQIISMRDNDLWKLVARDMFTGLPDADGREIYEGDIVESEGLVYKVDWHDCRWSLYRDSITPGHWYRHDLAPHTVCRVVGNIHESPELLNND